MLRGFWFVVPLGIAATGSQLAKEWYGFIGDLLSTTVIISTVGLAWYFPFVKDMLVGTASVTTVAVSNGLNWVASADRSPLYFGPNKSDLESKRNKQQVNLMDLLGSIQKDIKKEMKNRTDIEIKMAKQSLSMQAKSIERLEASDHNMKQLLLQNVNVNRKLIANSEASKDAIAAKLLDYVNPNGTANSKTMALTDTDRSDTKNLSDTKVGDLAQIPASLDKPHRNRKVADRRLEKNAGSSPGSGSLRGIRKRTPHVAFGKATLNEVIIKSSDEAEVESEDW